MTATQSAKSMPQAPAGEEANPLLSSSGHMPPERLRLLRSLFGRICQDMRDRLFDAAQVLFETSLEEIALQPVRRSGLMEPDHLVALCSIAHQNTLSCIGFDAAAVNLVIEAFLGGGAKGRSAPAPRQWTSFDSLLAGHAAEIFISAMKPAFAPMFDLVMDVDEIRPAETTAELALEERPVLCVRLVLSALDEQGTVTIILPPGLFSGLRACPAQEAPAMAGEEDENPWAGRLDSRIKTSEVLCRAVLDGGEITLEDVARFRPGQVLKLDVRKDAPVRLECDGQSLFHCDIGQAGGVFTLKLRRPVSDEEEFLQSMIGSKGAKQ